MLFVWEVLHVVCVLLLFVCLFVFLFIFFFFDDASKKKREQNEILLWEEKKQRIITTLFFNNILSCLVAQYRLSHGYVVCMSGLGLRHVLPHTIWTHARLRTHRWC